MTATKARTKMSSAEQRSDNAIIKSMPRKIVATTALAVFGVLTFFLQTEAQSARPQLIITWSASQSYAPPSYQGKTLPNQRSSITASLEAVSNVGKSIDLSGQTVYWYLNDNLLGGGAGVQRITFRPYGEAPNSLTLRAEVPNYPGGLLIHEVTVPVVVPQVVIAAPYPRNIFSASPAVVQAVPYFFAISSPASLGFSWLVNGQAVADAQNPQTLQISVPQNTPAGFALVISLAGQNAADKTSANANTTLTYQPRP